jgi:2-octaprenyl-6-methoxyphenol hydroxylase
MTPHSDALTCDVAIVGGGLVGASLVLALSGSGLSIVLIEAVPPEDDAQPSFDTRTTALSNGTRRIFEGLGVWDEIAREATAIRHIHISERGRFGTAVLDAVEQGIPALGFVVENRVIGRALWRRLRHVHGLTVVAPAEVLSAAASAAHTQLELRDGRAIRAKLAVAADGIASKVRESVGVGAARSDYGQVAIIAQATPGRFHDHVAYERFSDDGPIAALPIPDGRVGIIWTLAPDEATRVMSLDDAAFLREFQSAFGWRLGRFRAVSPRHAYPLALVKADAADAPRTAIIGAAAQGMHPIAGQGFNLGLRDAATLAEVIAESPEADPGSPEVLSRYAEWRRTDRNAIIGFTDGLVRLFGSRLTPVRWARSLGLMLFDVSPTAKSALSRLSQGFAGRLPRLARGLPLRGRAGESV